jgi:hypothetical protein
MGHCYSGKGRILQVIMLLLSGTLPLSIAAINDTPVPEYKIKAAYLYNFFLFVTWPSLPDQTVTIGILGRDSFGNAFSEVENQSVKGLKKKLVVKRWGAYTEQTGIDQCQILFVSSNERTHFTEIFKRLQGKPVLTVGDSEDFLEAGGMIDFLLVQNKVRWEINQRSLNAGGLRLNSQLLGNAIRVKSD